MQKRAIAGSRFDLLSRMRVNAGRLPVVMASPPTANTARGSGVSSLATMHDAILSGAPSAKYEYHCGNPAQSGASYPDTLFVQNQSVNYGSTVGASRIGNNWMLSFVTDAPAFEIFMKGLAGSEYRVLVDGELAGAAQVASKANDGGLYYDLYTFGTRAVRLVTLLLRDNLRFGGIKTDALSRVWKPRRNPNRVKAVFLGDSYAEGTGADYPDGSWAFAASSFLGWECWLSGVGNTGYVWNASGAKATFRSRFSADVSAYGPDVIVIAGGINDSGSTQAAIQAEAALLFGKARSENPDALIFVAGPWTGPGSTTPAGINAGIKAAAQATDGYGTRLFFIETMTDPVGAWQFGTGKAGATNGSGNSDVYVGTDGIHPVQAGHNYLGRRFAEAVKLAIAA